MNRISQQELLDAGVHFGHLKKKWNPKMLPYIFMERKGIHIIDDPLRRRGLRSRPFDAEGVAAGVAARMPKVVRCPLDATGAAAATAARKTSGLRTR